MAAICEETLAALVCKQDAQANPGRPPPAQRATLTVVALDSVAGRMPCCEAELKVKKLLVNMPHPRARICQL